jgi:Cd2+/Zn2+-exporting ATPase
MAKPQKLRLEVPLLLPDIPDARDHCVRSLIAALTGRTGIAEAHVVEEAGSLAQLCIHYDAGVIPLERVRELAQSVGAEITGRVGHLILRTDETFDAREASSLGAEVRKIEGVVEAEVAGSGVARLEFDRHLVTADC